MTGRETAAPSLELHLSRGVFQTGQRVSGVVIFRNSRSVGIRSISVCVMGREAPAGVPLARGVRNSPFFERDLLLSGMEQPRLAAERVSQFWNAFLGRDRGRTLSAGEHTYPFSIVLPASLPPSYEGRAGRIIYTVTARVQSLLGRMTRVSMEIPVVFVPRHRRARPVALSYPTADGSVHSGRLSVSLELPNSAVELGKRLRGRFSVSNPQCVSIAGATVTLETCEWVRLAAQREMDRRVADSCTITPQEPAPGSMQEEFELSVPPDAPPTVEGSAISVIWVLKLNLNADPPVELKTPITVLAPAE